MQLSWMNLNISAKKLILEEYLHIQSFHTCNSIPTTDIYKRFICVFLFRAWGCFFGGSSVVWFFKYCFFNLFHEFSMRAFWFLIDCFQRP